MDNSELHIVFVCVAVQGNSASLKVLGDTIHTFWCLPNSLLVGNSRVLFYFGLQQVGFQAAAEWNNMMKQATSYMDTGINGFQMPASVFEKILTEIRLGRLPWIGLLCIDFMSF